MVKRIMNNQEVPIDLVLSMRKQGMSNSEIVKSLQQQNFNSQKISDAINQVDIKKSVEVPLPAPVDEEGYSPLNVPMPPAPSDESSYEDESPLPSTEYGGFSQSYQESVEPESFQQPFGMNRSSDIEKVEELAESIIKEKWDELTKDIGNIRVWKENVKTELVSIKQEIIRTQERFENLQNAVLSKVQDYSRNIEGVNAELKAMEKVLEKILEPLSRNVKELSKITDELKKK